MPNNKENSAVSALVQDDRHLAFLVHRLKLTVDDEAQQQLILKEIEACSLDIAAKYYLIYDLLSAHQYERVMNICLEDIRADSPLQEFTRHTLFDLIISDRVQLADPAFLFKGLTSEQQHALQAYYLIDKYQDEDVVLLRRLCAMLLGKDENCLTPDSWGALLKEKYQLYEFFKSDILVTNLADNDHIPAPVAVSSPLASSFRLFNADVINSESGKEQDLLNVTTGERLTYG